MVGRLLVGLLAVGISGCYVVEEEPNGPPPEQYAGGEQPPPAAVTEPSQGPQAQDQPAQIQPQAGPVQPQTSPVQPPPPQPMPPTQPGLPAGTGAIDVSCAFDQGWVAVVPLSIYQRGDEFIMQALIGFSSDPSFWAGQPEYQDLRPYAAQQCMPAARRFQVQPGRYVLLVGWAGRFQAQGSYARNGRIEHVNIRDGQVAAFNVTTNMLNHEFVCISCPYLVVIGREGRAVELGQVLVDRYTSRREGTDTRVAELDVRNGRIVVLLEEREPEVSRVDAVELRVAGRALPLAAGAPDALRAIDGSRQDLSMGETLELPFDATGLPDSVVSAEIRVTGHYVPVGPLL